MYENRPQRIWYDADDAKQARRQIEFALGHHYPNCQFAVIIKGNFLIIEILRIPFYPLTDTWDPRRGIDDKNRRWTYQFEGFTKDIEILANKIFSGETYIYLSWALYAKLKQEHYE